MGSYDLPLNSRGYNLISAYASASMPDSERLPSRIIQFYLTHTKTLIVDTRIRANDVENTITDWKTRYNWYADLITDRDNTGFIAYALNDPDYKNRVANYYMLNFTIYLPFLDDYSNQAKALLKEIGKRID